jgi:hypothetical protein
MQAPSSPAPKAPHARTAIDLAHDVPLSPPGKKLLTAQQSPAQFLKALADRGHYVDALRLMAVALLPREAVWWACLCCRHTLGAKAPPAPAEDHALQAAAQWVTRPDEPRRKAAEVAGAAAGPKTAAGCAAQAAGFGGVAKSPDQPVVPAYPRMVAKLAGASVLLAAVQGATDELDLNYRQFLALGIDADNHLCHWDPRLDAKPAPHDGAALPPHS